LATATGSPSGTVTTAVEEICGAVLMAASIGATTGRVSPLAQALDWRDALCDGAGIPR
jgi:hypothetical protein